MLYPFNKSYNNYKIFQDIQLDKMTLENGKSGVPSNVKKAYDKDEPFREDSQDIYNQLKLIFDLSKLYTGTIRHLVKEGPVYIEGIDDDNGKVGYPPIGYLTNMNGNPSTDDFNQMILLSNTNHPVVPTPYWQLLYTSKEITTQVISWSSANSVIWKGGSAGTESPTFDQVKDYKTESWNIISNGLNNTIPIFTDWTLLNADVIGTNNSSGDLTLLLNSEVFTSSNKVAISNTSGTWGIIATAGVSYDNDPPNLEWQTELTYIATFGTPDFSDLSQVQWTSVLTFTEPEKAQDYVWSDAKKEKCFKALLNLAKTSPNLIALKTKLQAIKNLIDSSNGFFPTNSTVEDLIIRVDITNNLLVTAANITAIDNDLISSSIINDIGDAFNHYQAPALLQERYNLISIRSHRTSGTFSKIPFELAPISYFQGLESNITSKLTFLKKKYWMIPIKSVINNDTIVIPKLAIRDGLDAKPINYTNAAIIGERGWIKDIQFDIVTKIVQPNPLPVPDLQYEVESVIVDPEGNMIIKNLTCVKLKLRNGVKIPEQLQDSVILFEKTS